jgi:hypothetical protein
MIRCLTWILLTCGLITLPAAARPVGEKTEANELIVIDQNGKEYKPKTWKIIEGTRRLSWLGPAADKDTAKGKKPGPAGPEALVFTEGDKQPHVKRVLTWVPVESLRSINYDTMAKTVSLRVAVNDKESDDATIEGVTGYQNTNKFTIEALSDLGELGQATAKFQGGVEKGVQSFKFTHPKPIAALPAGRLGKIKQKDPKLPTFKFADLQVLYSSGNQERTSPYLYFKETVKVDLAKISKLVQVGAAGIDFTLTLKDGNEYPSLALIDRPKDTDGKTSIGQLEGFVGRGIVGWRLFPMIIVGELQFQDKND